MVTKAKILSAVASLMCPSFQVADQPGETHADDVQRLADLGSGVLEVKTEPGKPKSLKVVGQARISNDLGKAKGMEIAQQQAKARALETLADWIQSRAKSTSDDGTDGMPILDGNGLDEQSQASAGLTHDITAKATAKAAAISRELVLEDQHVDANGELLTLIYAWSEPRYAVALGAGGSQRRHGHAGHRCVCPPIARAPGQSCGSGQRQARPQPG